MYCKYYVWFEKNNKPLKLQSKSYDLKSVTYGDTSRL